MSRRTNAAVVTAGMLAVLVTGCGSDEVDAARDRAASVGSQVTSAAGSAAAAASSAATSAASAASSAANKATSALGKTAVIVITDGKVSGPDRLEASKGDTIRLVITSDQADEAHVHGYDITEALPANRPTTVQFTADQTGQFTVERHSDETALIQLQVR